MAYTGAIEYIKPAFNGVKWVPMQSPWFPTQTDNGAAADGTTIATNVKDHQGSDMIALVATAHKFNTSQMSSEPSLRWDDPGAGAGTSRGQAGGADDGTLCVILGAQKDIGPSASSLTSQGTVRQLSASLTAAPWRTTKRHGLLSYLILVRPLGGGTKDQGGTTISLYERVGAGYLPEKCIVAGSGLTVTVI